MAKLAVIASVFLVSLFIREAEPVRCWTCSSDLNHICNDPFFAGRSENTYNLPLENCDANTGANYPYLTSSKSACKKMKKYINGLQVVSRGCTWKRQDDYTNGCPSSTNGPNEYTTFCETCDYDGCNSATAVGKTLALLMAPLGLLLFNEYIDIPPEISKEVFEPITSLTRGQYANQFTLRQAGPASGFKFIADAAQQRMRTLNVSSAMDA